MYIFEGFFGNRIPQIEHTAQIGVADKISVMDIDYGTPAYYSSKTKTWSFDQNDGKKMAVCVLLSSDCPDGLPRFAYIGPSIQKEVQFFYLYNLISDEIVREFNEYKELIKQYGEDDYSGLHNTEIMLQFPPKFCMGLVFMRYIIKLRKLYNGNWYIPAISELYAAGQHLDYSSNNNIFFADERNGCMFSSLLDRVCFVSSTLDDDLSPYYARITDHTKIFRSSFSKRFNMKPYIMFSANDLFEMYYKNN